MEILILLFGLLPVAFLPDMFDSGDGAGDGNGTGDDLPETDTGGTGDILNPDDDDDTPIPGTPVGGPVLTPDDGDDTPVPGTPIIGPVVTPDDDPDSAQEPGGGPLIEQLLEAGRDANSEETGERMDAKPVTGPGDGRESLVPDEPGRDGPSLEQTDGVATDFDGNGGDGVADGFGEEGGDGLGAGVSVSAPFDGSGSDMPFGSDGEDGDGPAAQTDDETGTGLMFTVAGDDAVDDSEPTDPAGEGDDLDTFWLYYDHGSASASAQIGNFVRGKDFLRISLNPDANGESPEVVVAPSDDGTDGVVRLNGTVVAVLRGVPDLALSDLYVDAPQNLFA